MGDRQGGARATAVLLLVCTIVGSGSTACGTGGEPSPPRPGNGASEPDPATPEQATEPWRFVPTLEQHLPAGAVAEPVLELSQPRQRSVVVLAAVLRAGSEHVELERWTFEQNPDGESLNMVEGGIALIRVRPGARHPQLADLRRAVAAPRAVLNRPMGLEATEPKAALDQLAAALATMHDQSAEPRARVQAAATVVRGLDDTVLLERDAVWEVAAALDPAPSEVQLQRLSDRRAKAVLELPGGPATLELQRKSGGWAVSSAEVPAAPPPPPTGDTETGGGTVD